MIDFLGQALSEGDYIVYPGGGNRNAEYGLLLLKVKVVKADSIVCERLDALYDPKRILRKNSTIQQTTKVAKVSPSAKMIDVFENAEKNFELVAKWIHGRTTLKW